MGTPDAGDFGDFDMVVFRFGGYDDRGLDLDDGLCKAIYDVHRLCLCLLSYALSADLLITVCLGGYACMSAGGAKRPGIIVGDDNDLAQVHGRWAWLVGSRRPFR